MQTAVNSQLPIGVAGQLADHHTETAGDVMPAINTEASDEIPFGCLMKKGTGDDGVERLDAANNAIAGISVHTNELSQPTQLGDVGVKPSATFGRLLEGHILVMVEEAVTPASAVRVRHGGVDLAASPQKLPGGFRTSAVAGETAVLSAAKFLTSAGAGELAVLNVDLLTSTLTADV
jgi:hypothetical protein